VTGYSFIRPIASPSPWRTQALLVISDGEIE
jgi:hypothetical protein